MYLFVVLTCLLCLGGWIPAASGQTISRTVVLPSTTIVVLRPAVETISLPDCASTCISTLYPSCDPGDFKCHCQSQLYIDVVYQCIKGGCSPEDTSLSTGYFAKLCLDAGALLLFSPIVSNATISQTAAPVPSTKTTVVTSLSTTSTGLLSNNTPATTSLGLSTTAKIALGVSIPVGIVVLCTCAFIVFYLWPRIPTARKPEHQDVTEPRVELA